MDEIHIRDLVVRTIIGTNPEERLERQDVLINITLYTDTRPAGRSDDLADTINYRDVAKKVMTLAEQSQFYLVEKLAEEIAALALSDPRVDRVRVAVEKPGAVRFARSVGVCIERGRV
ncbi:MAG: 7,8-dihydroneopterin aldolase [Pirellulaceae bacterium]|nr:MAG: 7,8-dihydroneopterin aldolase [Pirellulaceae bacterium]